MFMIPPTRLFTFNIMCSSPNSVVMIGDGATDMEASPPAVSVCVSVCVCVCVCVRAHVDVCVNVPLAQLSA